MQNSYKTYKTGIALNFSKKTLIIWCVVAIVISFSVFAIISYPLNLTVFTVIFGIMLFMLVVGLLLNKFVMGMRVKMFDDRVWIYRSNAFMLKPANDELMLNYSTSGYLSSVVVTYSNIVSVRKISKEEVTELSKINNVPINVGVGAFPIPRINIPANKQKQLLLKFICDYSNVVEITVKTLTEPDTSTMSSLKALASFTLQVPKIQVQNEKLLVSINNPDDFIQEIGKKQTLPQMVS